MSELKRVIELATLMVAQRKKVDTLKSDLDQAQRDLRRIEQEDLPELMREIGMKSVTLEDGSVVDVVEDVECGISEERRANAHAWLIANGFGGLIKTEVVTTFGRGEGEAAQTFAAEVAESTGQAPQVAERVHPATLKSFIKEQLAAGVAIPFDAFGIHPFNKARLKPAK